ncbi:alpha/beta fold hydrolase [Mesoterricola sediminis]|uniref:Alpha/beta hydrolase n=1 Tax=Mesoterricola sediminis TaxID=2927980 RepID=A0AA48GQS2_9BACT|nr:alpha/beta hydrolase [Mesoterricola sediminis]BDU77531.1 alpha/beta hydrolase [Mesoterricola sediminis]
MNTLTILIAAVAATVCAVGVAAGRKVMKDPLKLYNRAARRSLVSKGLRQIQVASPSGPQSAFVGGEGPVLVLLHGAGDQAGTWSRVAPELLEGRTLILPDLAGHGDSAPAEGPIDTSAVYHGLEAILASELKGRKAVVAGNSLGAWMAMVLADRHPDWVERVIAINGGPLIGTSSVRLLPRTREEAREAFAALRDPGSPAVPDAVLDEMVRDAPTSPLARFASTAATMLPWVMDEAKLRTFQTPVTLVWGVSDRMMDLAYADRMLQALPGARLIRIEGCGHVPHQESPARFLEAFRQAL